MKAGLPWYSLVILMAVTSNAAEARQAERAASSQCPAGMDFQAQGYHIRDAAIQDPWHFLQTLGMGSDEADKAVRALKGQPYDDAELIRVQKIVEEKRFLPADIQASTIVRENCSDKQVDVIFEIISIQITPAIGPTFELRQKEKLDPEGVAGPSHAGQNVRLVSRVGYDGTQRLLAGGTLETRWTAQRIPLDSFSMEGLGSSSMHSASATLSGQHDSTTSWLQHSEWRLDFQNSSAPTDQASLSQGRLAIQFQGESHPVKGIVLRLGATVEGGNQQSGFSHGNLAPNTVASSSYSSAKFYGGLTAHPSHQAVSLSYGLGLGAVGATLQGDWRKSIGDLAHELWWGDHGRFAIEQRFAAGLIQIPGVIPVAERFFGGNCEEQFVPGTTWQIRANPFIRSIPANRFYRTSAGVGGSRFLSYNLTLAVMIWNIPLVPTELTADADFKKKKNGALTSATNTLQVVHASKDQHFLDLLPMLPEIQAKLEALNGAVAHAQIGAPDSLESAFQSCIDAIGSSINLVQHAIKDKPIQAYGSVQELLPDGTGALADAVSTCGTDLNSTLHDPAIASKSTDLDALGKQLQACFGLINQPGALKKAQADMSYVTRTLGIILNDMNIASISPVLAFDAAHIGPAAIGPYSGTRYGVGSGFRFSLASTVDFTAGYSWNPDRRPGESIGAFFFSLKTRKLFQ